MTCSPTMPRLFSTKSSQPSLARSRPRRSEYCTRPTWWKPGGSWGTASRRLPTRMQPAPSRRSNSPRDSRSPTAGWPKVTMAGASTRLSTTSLAAHQGRERPAEAVASDPHTSRARQGGQCLHDPRVELVERPQKTPMNLAPRPRRHEDVQVGEPVPDLAGTAEADEDRGVD